MFATPGQVIADRFELERHVGAGGMGVVFRAIDRGTEGMAAIKLVRAADAHVCARFEREARVLAELAHPHIVGYIGHGTAADGALYLAMEWLDGEDLATRLEVASLSVPETLELVTHAASALAAAHARGIVHRDIKPSNLMLVDWRPERVKLLDFGIAHLEDLTSLTHTGALIGTPQYMAPEQLDGRDIDARTDVFALGAVLFHCLVGRPPFPARTMPELVASLTSAEPAPRVRSRVPDVPAWLDELTARMLAKDPASRPRDGAAVIAALEARTATGARSSIATAETGIVAPPAASAMEELARGRAAFVEGRWHEAREAYERSLALQDTPEGHAALGDVLWWLADLQGNIAHLEIAYGMFRKSEDPASVMQAGLMAMLLAMTHAKSLDNDAATSGWVARAKRLLGEEPGPLHGMLWIVQALTGKDPAHAVALSERALAHARAAKDHATELIALAALGGALVAAGDLERGLALIDESMAETFNSDTAAFETVVPVTCCMVIACDQIADTKRLLQWCRVADRFMAKYGSPLLFAECRAHYGSALLATGQWSDAERELRAARDATSRETRYYTLASTRLAELRIRQGRIAEAEELIADISERPQTRAAAAALRHLAGEHALASALLRRFIDGAGSHILDVTAALDLMVDAALAAGNRETAELAVGRLGELAKVHHAKVVAAHAEFAAGRFAAVVGSPASARSALERATDLFIAANAPHEAARVRFALAKLLATHDTPVAAEEARTAKSMFDKLGAERDAAAAGDLLRTLGS